MCYCTPCVGPTFKGECKEDDCCEYTTEPSFVTFGKQVIMKVDVSENNSTTTLNLIWTVSTDGNKEVVISNKDKQHYELKDNNQVMIHT